MITAQIVADSINPKGVRITSWFLTYPRFIHSEFMTHRVFSRNAASSRAIPFKKMVQGVLMNPAMPEKWGAEQKGMQSGDNVADIASAQYAWLEGREVAVDVAERMADLGLHKSLCNRLLEPFSHISVLATATDHRNFFALRAHPDAQPEFQVLAYRMLELYLSSKAAFLDWEDWHMPIFKHPLYAAIAFGDGDDVACNIEQRLKIATARCARLSYLTQAGQHDPEADILLHDRLAASGHWSPFEHSAQAIYKGRPGAFKDRPYPWSNFDWGTDCSGWGQYRKTFVNENCKTVNLQEVLANKPSWIQA